jgi:hypothetical protein
MKDHVFAQTLTNILDDDYNVILMSFKSSSSINYAINNKIPRHKLEKEGGIS